MTAFDMQDMDGQWGWLKIRKDYFKPASAHFCFHLITVKRRLGPALENSVSNWLHDRIRTGDILNASAPRGRFVLDPDGSRPIVLLSAGIGVTPMIAMLDHLTGGESGRARQPDRPTGRQADRPTGRLSLFTATGTARPSPLPDISACSPDAIQT